MTKKNNLNFVEKFHQLSNEYKEISQKIDDTITIEHDYYSLDATLQKDLKKLQTIVTKLSKLSHDLHSTDRSHSICNRIKYILATYKKEYKPTRQ